MYTYIYSNPILHKNQNQHGIFKASGFFMRLYKKKWLAKFTILKF